MADKTLQVAAERLKQLSAGQLLGALHRIALVHAARAETHAKTVTFPKALKTRTGRLQGSIAGRAKRTPGGVAIALSAGGGGKDVKYAATHEFGATIRPVKAKMLAIPVHDELKTKAGVGRMPGPRDVPGLTFAISKKGQRMLIHEKTNEVWYILRQRVIIPKRPFLKPAIDHTLKQIEPELAALLGEQELI
jgi:phage gpG-like protein